jgi:putative SOS response-associated peptidase YedK
MINARSEGIAAKPAYRDAYRYRRCIIPADGFYEWETAGKVKQPYFIHRADGQTIAIAGLWEHWQDAHGNEIESCTIITTASNADVTALHDRMPVILESGIWGKWLGPLTPMEEVGTLLAPAPAHTLEAYPVGKRVSNPRQDDAAMIDPVQVRRDVQQDLFGG